MLDRDVLVLGDVICDEWRFVARASHNPENAFLCVRSRPGKEIISLGGAGLTALCLRQLGLPVRLFGALSVCNRASQLLRILCQQRINTDSLISLPAGASMPRKLRDIDDVGRVLVRHDVEDPWPEDAPALFPRDEYLRALKNAACVVVADYSKGYLNYNREYVVDAAQQAGVPVFVDCKAAALESYDGATVFKINLPTAKTFAPHNYARKDIVEYVHRRLKPELAVVTCGGDGVWWCLGDTANHERFAAAHYGGNAVGAGDAFFSGLIAWLLMAPAVSAMTSAVVRDALLFGHIVAVEKLRTVVPDLSPARALAGYCRERSRESVKHKIMPNAAFAAFARACHLAGDKVVFTNGCFDVFHAGHLRLLQQAKKLGAVLVVALDSDKNVRRLKGADRPAYDEAARAALLATLQLVDAVTVFTDDESNSVLRGLIRDCAPDFLVKGGDYIPQECVGWAEITQRKDPGAVVCFDLLPNVSTTKILEDLKHGERAFLTR